MWDDSRVRGMRLAAALVVAVLLAACGDDGETAAPTTTSTTLSAVQLDKQKAQQVVLSAADLPGYTEDAPDPDDEDEIAGGEHCLNSNPLLIRLGERDDPRGAFSPDFSRDAHTVSSSVTYGENDEEARSAMSVMTAQATATCLSEALTTELQTAPGFANVRVTNSRLPGVTAGEENVGYRLVVRASAGGQSVTINIEFSFMRAGRGLAVFQTISETTTFPAGDRARIMALIGGRLNA